MAPYMGNLDLASLPGYKGIFRRFLYRHLGSGQSSRVVWDLLWFPI